MDVGRHDRDSRTLVAQVPRPRLTFWRETALVALPLAAVLGVFALVDVFSQQRMLFTSLASSAFLIYLEPHHGTNQARTLVTAQLSAAVVGYACDVALGSGYAAGGLAIAITVLTMIALRAMHPPAVSTTLSFAFRSGGASNVVVFGMAVALTASLVALQRGMQWALIGLSAGDPAVAGRRAPPVEGA